MMATLFAARTSPLLLIQTIEYGESLKNGSKNLNSLIKHSYYNFHITSIAVKALTTK
jgi:hypothetical protein